MTRSGKRSRRRSSRSSGVSARKASSRSSRRTWARSSGAGSSSPIRFGTVRRSVPTSWRRSRESPLWTTPTKKEGNAAELRYLASYPFHPDLTEVFYTKWTQLEGFQRTRGVLRTFALALRDAARWDQSPLVGPNVFLTEPGKSSVSAAAREVADVASKEEYEGKRQEWDKILEGELAKARTIQDELSGLNFREVEQAVFATFLHSQPVGHRASLRDLTLLCSPQCRWTCR